jgi:hypothetical protein
MESVIFFSGCSFPFQSKNEIQLTDISDELNFQNLKHNAFMGGSVLYNPENPSTGQLANGVNIGVRLGTVVCREVYSDEIVFTDKEDTAIYGYITINFINENEICFTYFYYDTAGLFKFQNSFILRRGECIDINFDGYYDLKYDYPLRKRPSFEKALWLTFLSNQETRNTSMFSILPEQYSRGIYPSGIMGINPDGKFIVNKYEVNSTDRAVVQGLINGDYVMDSITGTYQKIINKTSFKNARTIEDEELDVTEEIKKTDYYFYSEEFDDYMAVDEFLNVLPKSIINSIDVDISGIDLLNKILELRNLIIELAIENDLPIDMPEVIDLINTLDCTTQENVVQFNRYLLKTFFSDYCPDVSLNNNSIASIFPLLSVLISNPECETLENCEIQRSASTIGTANNYSDYISQKKDIDTEFKCFYPIKNCSYTFPGWKKFIQQLQGDVNESVSQSEKNKDLKGKTGTFEEIVKVLKTSPKTNIPKEIDNKAKLSLGIMGHFKITFSNIEGGIYAGVYISADTSLEMTKILAKYPTEEIPKLCCSAEEKLVNINLSMLNAPPITIGVVTLQFSLCGGLEIPASVTLKGTVTTSFYAGFTGLYAAGFDMGIDYGVKTKSIKVWKLKITIPTGIYCYPYVKGNVINKTASFVGPVSEITTIPFVKIQSSSLEMCIRPYIYFEPGITVANCLYGGIKIGPSLDIGCGLKLNVNDSLTTPESLEFYCIFGGGLELRAAYGVNIGIAGTPFKIEKKDDVVLPNQLRKEKKNYSLWTLTL